MAIRLIIANILIVFWVVFTASSPADDAVKLPTKKVNKVMSKIWKDASLQLKPLISTNAEFIRDPESQIYTIIDGNDTLGFAYVGRVYSCRSGGCEVNLSEESASYEYFDYFFVANTEVSILKVKVFNYQATHGHEVMGWGWLRQFVGYSGSHSLIYGKDIQAISGATISASALTQRIQQDQKYLSNSLN